MTTEIAPTPVNTSKRLRTGLATFAPSSQQVLSPSPSSISVEQLPDLLFSGSDRTHELQEFLTLAESSSAFAEKIFKFILRPEFLQLLEQHLQQDNIAVANLLTWKNLLRYTTTRCLSGIAGWHLTSETYSALVQQLIPGTQSEQHARAALHLLLLADQSSLTREQMLVGVQALVQLLADRVSRQPVIDIEYAQAAHLLLHFLTQTGTATTFLHMPFAARILAAGLDLGLLARFSCLLLARKTFYMPYVPRALSLSTIVLRLLRQTASPVSDVAKLATKVLLSSGLENVSVECLVESGVAPLLNLMSKGKGYGPAVAPLIQTLRDKVSAALPQVAFYLTLQGTPLQKRAAITLLAQPRNVIPPAEAYEIVLRTAFEEDVCFDALLVLTARTEMHRRVGLVLPAAASLNDVSQQHANEVCMSHLLLSERFSDVRFVLDDGSQVPAHKAILCSQPYFDRLLTGGFRESQNSVLHVTDTHAHTFRQVLASVYGLPARELSFGSVTEAFSLLVALDRYQIAKGCAECIRYLSEHLDGECIEQLLQASLSIPAAEPLFAHCLLWLLDAKNLVNSMPLLRELFTNEGNRIRQFFLELVASASASSSSAPTN